MEDTKPQGQGVLPEWVQCMGVATWVTGPDGGIVYINGRAEELLGVKAENVLGLGCPQVVAGKNEDGETWCRAHCHVHEKLDEGGEVEPYTMRIESRTEEEHWLQMLVIPFRNHSLGGACIAHCAFNIDRSHMIESYLDRIAARTPLNADRDFSLEKSRLSKREREVLELLSEDENLYSIAEKLNVSYYTVRNHVQHILGKMGVHSTLEAVALYLLAKSQGEN